MSQNPAKAQLEAIIGAAVDKAVADTTQRLSAAFKAKTEGLLANRDDLLAENRRLKGKADGEPPRRTHDRNGQPFDRFYTQEDEDRHLALMARLETTKPGGDRSTRSPSPDIGTSQKEVVISRNDARDARKYKAAKTSAEARGVNLRIVDSSEQVGVDRKIGNNSGADRRTSVNAATIRQFDDPVQRRRYLRRDQIQGAPIRHRLAAERDGFKLVVFSSFDDLDEGGLAAYREAGGEE